MFWWRGIPEAGGREYLPPIITVQQGHWLYKQINLKTDKEENVIRKCFWQEENIYL